MSVMNERSILISVAGNFARYSIEALPVPKSSTDTRCPWHAGPRAPRPLCGSAIAALSVTSTMSLSGGIRWRSRIAATRCGSSVSSRFRADRLTDICMSIPRPRQVTSSERLVDQCQRERPDQSGLLDQRNELRWSQHAMLGVMPAHQGLDTGDAPALKLDLWLVLKDELAAFQCAATSVSSFNLRGVEVVDSGEYTSILLWCERACASAVSARCNSSSGSVGVLAHDRDADARLDVERRRRRARSEARGSPGSQPPRAARRGRPRRRRRGPRTRRRRDAPRAPHPARCHADGEQPRRERGRRWRCRACC